MYVMQATVLFEMGKHDNGLLVQEFKYVAKRVLCR